MKYLLHSVDLNLLTIKQNPLKSPAKKKILVKLRLQIFSKIYLFTSTSLGKYHFGQFNYNDNNFTTPY